MQKDFSNQTFILPKETIFYLYSDGYQDQNNPERKRIGSKGLKSELLKISNLELSHQKEHLEDLLLTFMDGSEQRDDISIVGLKVF